MKKNFVLRLACSVALACATSASNAMVYELYATSMENYYIMDLQITTSDTVRGGPAYVAGYGGYDILSVTGTIQFDYSGPTLSVDSLVDVNPDVYGISYYDHPDPAYAWDYWYDNVLYSNPGDSYALQTPFLDEYGMLFTLEDGTVMSLIYDGTPWYFLSTDLNNYEEIFIDRFNMISGPAPVPIPAAAWLFASGLLGLIGVACRRNHN